MTLRHTPKSKLFEMLQYQLQGTDLEGCEPLPSCEPLPHVCFGFFTLQKVSKSFNPVPPERTVAECWLWNRHIYRELVLNPTDSQNPNGKWLEAGKLKGILKETAEKKDNL